MVASPPYVTRFEAKNFGCLRSVNVDLTQLHAFIGPNDSGKTTILQGIRTLMNVVSIMAGNPGEDPRGDKRLGPGLRLSLATSNGVHCLLSRGIGQTEYERAITLDGGRPLAQDTTKDLLTPAAPFIGFPEVPDDWRTLLLRGARVVRLDPDEMRKPGAIVPDDGSLNFYGDRGLGLAAIYDRIRDDGNDKFGAIEENIRKLFPTVKKVGFEVPQQGTKSFKLELVDGTRVSAENMSEGLLYYLGFAAIPHLDPTSALLVEEPENGLHPARIKEVVRILREISRTTQVLIATHSPLVINEMNPEEVTLVTRDAETGTQTTPMRDTPNFAERSKVYALGELWLSYADGETEAPLLSKSVA